MIFRLVSGLSGVTLRKTLAKSIKIERNVSPATGASSRLVQNSRWRLKNRQDRSANHVPNKHSPCSSSLNPDFHRSSETLRRQPLEGVEALLSSGNGSFLATDQISSCCRRLHGAVGPHMTRYLREALLTADANGWAHPNRIELLIEEEHQLHAFRRSRSHVPPQPHAQSLGLGLATCEIRDKQASQ